MTSKIDRLKAAFAVMDERAGNELLLIAETLAQAHPRKMAGGHLSLVASSTLTSRPVQVLEKPEHVGSTAIISAVK